MTKEELHKLLPHRPPFLFVDEVIEIGGDAIKTAYRVDPELACFTGHFPGAPVMPGVLLCECCLQAGAVLMAVRTCGATSGVQARSASEGSHSTDAVTLVTAAADRPAVPVVTRILEAKFKRVVRPGDMLAIDVSLEEEMGGVFFMIGRVTVADEVAVRCKFAVTAMQA